MSNSLWPHEWQHTRLPCPSLSPTVCSNACPFGQWCHPTSLSSVVPFSSCLQSLPASVSFPMSLPSCQVAKILELQLQHQSFQEIFRIDFFRIDWFDLLAVQGTLKSLLQHHKPKASILWHSAFYMAQLLHPYMTTGKNIALTRWTFVGKVISLLFNILSSFLIAFFPSNKCLLISWLKSPSAVINF